MALFALAYFAGACLGRILSLQPGPFDPFWLPAGLQLAILLRTPTTRWPVFLLTGSLTSFAFDFWQQQPVPVALAYAITNGLEALLGAALVRRLLGPVFRLNQLAFFCLVGVVIGTITLGATGGASVALIAFGEPFVASWLTWWVSDFLGVLVALPLVLACFGGQQDPAHVSGSHWEWIERVGMMVAGCVVAQIAFGGYLISGLHPYLVCTPVFLWVSQRGGWRGVACLMFFVAVIAMANTQQGNGPYAVAEESTLQRVILVQIVICASSLVNLALAIAIHDLRQAKAALNKSENFLNSTGRLARVGGWELDAATRQVFWTEATYHIHEVSLDYDPPLDEAIHFYHAEDRPVLRQALELALARGIPFDLELRFTTANGRHLIVRAICQPVVEAGHVVRLVGTFQDITPSKQAEAALRESEERFRLNFEESAVGNAAVGLNLRFLRVNKRLCQMLGYSSEELLRLGVLDITHPDDRQISTESIRKLVSGELQDFATEKRYIRKDGSCFWGHLTTRLLRDATGQPLYFLPTMQDISERKLAEEARQAAHARFEGLVESVNGIVWEADARTWQMLFVSPAVERILGYPISDWRAPNFWIDHIYAEDRANAEQTCRSFTLAGEKHQLLYRMVARDGRLVWFQDDVVVIMKDGQPSVLRGVMVDVTELRQVTETAQRLNERFQLAAEAAGFGIWDIDLKSGTVVWDAQMFALYGMPGSEDPQFPRFWLSRVHPEDRQQLEQLTHAALTGTDRFETEFRIHWPNAEVRYHRACGRVVRDAAGQPVRLTGVTMDCTALKREELRRLEMEQQLRQADKMRAIGQLAAGIAHDFNNLLTVISGYSDMLLEDVHPEDPMRDSLQEIHTAGSRAGTLTRQLLAFSRLQLLNPRLLNLNAVVQTCEKMLQRVLGEDIRLHCDLSLLPHQISADLGQVEQVLLNLAVNARDAMPQGGTLEIATQEIDWTDMEQVPHPDAHSKRYVVLTVRDTGCGMTPEVRERIFEPFFTTKEQGKGTGLGLATVFAIAKQCEGFIIVDSQVGVGTTISVHFPAQTQGGPQTLEASWLGNWVGTETLLLVEDERLVRSVVRQALLRRGYQLLEAENGRQALQVAQNHAGPIHLLVTDVVMPEMGGRQLAEALQPQRPEMKVLFMSGYTDDAVLRYGVPVQEVAFLHKPFSPGILARKVRDVLEEPQKQAAPLCLSGHDSLS